MCLLIIYILFALFIVSGCTSNKHSEVTPWGGMVSKDTSYFGDSQFTFDDIQNNGEMIMLTLSGPDTYFDYRGRGMGTQFLLCEKFAHTIGVSLRVEVCKDTMEMVERLKRGEGDIIVFQLPKSGNELRFCGYGVDSLNTSWAVNIVNSELADTIDRWFKPSILNLILREESYWYSSHSIRRHKYSPMLDSKSGVISEYDHLFKKYALSARWDWRLLAAQCYQESTFDPQAYSWAGACGLMQIMPATAREIGLSDSQIYDPEQNISAAMRYIRILNGKFQDIRNMDERYSFILASYNGGFLHIRDAMALAKKYGRNPYVWSDVSYFVLKLSSPEYYKDPAVKYGYMRGHETADYVESIRNRWLDYRKKTKGGYSFFGVPDNVSPQKARHKHRFKL